PRKGGGNAVARVFTSATLHSRDAPEDESGNELRSSCDSIFLTFIRSRIRKDLRSAEHLVELGEVKHPVLERCISSGCLQARIIVARGARHSAHDATRKDHQAEADLSQFFGCQQRRIAALHHVGEQWRRTAKLAR